MSQQVEVAVAKVVGEHHRRHPALTACCCGWSGSPTMTWRQHLARELAEAGLLADEPTAEQPTPGADPDAELHP